MPPKLTRLPLLVALFFGAALARPVTGQAQEIDSGGLGISREAWEALHGPGDPIDMINPVWGELTAYAFDGGMYYVAFSGSKEEAGGIVVSIEVAFAPGVTSGDAVHAVIDPLLPSDATFADSYYLPPSPGALSAIQVTRYESAGLGSVPYADITLEPTFLVLQVGRVEATRTTGQFDASMVFETTVTRVSIAVAIPEG
jgi:hypothetical protein